MKKLLMSSILLMSTSIFANELTELSASNPNSTKWEILKQLYEKSSSQAELSDFDKGDNASSGQKCRLAFPKSTPETLQNVVIRQMLRTVPGDGPLFPARTITKLNITNVSYLTSGVVNDVFYKAFDYTTVTDDSYDLIITQTKNENHVNSPFKLLLRKNGDLISFKILTYKNNEDNGPLFEKDVDDSYGYCWRE